MLYINDYLYSPDQLEPGKWVPFDEFQRDATMELMQQVAAKNGAAIQPVSTRHVTLWAAKGTEKVKIIRRRSMLIDIVAAAIDYLRAAAIMPRPGDGSIRPSERPLK